VSRIRRFSVSFVLLVLAVVVGSPVATAQAKTVWLCNGARAHDLCKPSLTTTILSNSGAVEAIRRVKRQKPRVDCFYVYPTVSDDKTANSDLSIDPEERSIALYQAARYSQLCRVFAPMYRQVTLTQLLKGESTITAQARNIAYSSALSGWKAYLRGYNHDRPFVLIGHSQGSGILRKLIATQIDPNPKLRELMVSAIVLGGNVLVKKGEGIGGDFKHIPGCRTVTQTSCVIAFSTFDAPVPPNSLFGRPAALNSGGPPAVVVLCALPGTHRLSTILPSAPFAPSTVIGAASTGLGYPHFSVHTPWVEFDHAYTGACSSANNAHVLQIKDLPGAPHLNPIPDATWGLHLADANIALGNLVGIVADEVNAYFKRAR
jgi:hypothetical protein